MESKANSCYPHGSRVVAYCKDCKAHVCVSCVSQGTHSGHTIAAAPPTPTLQDFQDHATKAVRAFDASHREAVSRVNAQFDQQAKVLEGLRAVAFKRMDDLARMGLEILADRQTRAAAAAAVPAGWVPKDPPKLDPELDNINVLTLTRFGSTDPPEMRYTRGGYSDADIKWRRALKVGSAVLVKVRKTAGPDGYQPEDHHWRKGEIKKIDGLEVVVAFLQEDNSVAEDTVSVLSLRLNQV